MDELTELELTELELDELELDQIIDHDLLEMEEE